MRRTVLTIGVGLTLFAAACGDPTYAELEEELVDEGMSQEEASCVVQGLEAAGVPAKAVTDSAIEKDGLPDAAGEVLLDCTMGGLAEGLDLDLDDLGVDADDIADIGSQEGQSYGDNPDLDAMWNACEGGDGGACDDLYWQSPVDSEYEEYGRTCGNRLPEGALSCADGLG